MKANLKKSREGVRKWARWIGGGALVLALAGVLAPTTTTAVVNNGGEMVDEEVIEIEGTAPWTLPNWGGHTGGGTPNGTPSGDSGGGGGGGGEGVPSAGDSQPAATPAQTRLANLKTFCQSIPGTWTTAIFKDYDTNVALAGYVCITHLETPNTTGSTTTVKASSIRFAGGPVTKRSWSVSQHRSRASHPPAGARPVGRRTQLFKKLSAISQNTRSWKLYREAEC